MGKTADRIYHAAIYVRLSKEDGDVASAAKAESNSISNQKNLIKDFLKDKDDIIVVSEYVDDGYSGSNFDRPGFQMMMEDIKRGKVDCVVVKDLSRFGREYIDSGKYIERLFPALGVRFIAVNDHIDSREESGRDDIVVPFKNLMNDAYCRDISIKIRSHLEVKRKNGEYTGAFTPYGYKKDENDRNRLVPDLYAAGVVKGIFRMKLGGMSQSAIAESLNRQGVLSPVEYKHSLGIRMLYEDLKDGIVSKEDYAELYEGYNSRRKKAEEAVRKLRNEIQKVMEAKTDKYEWLRYFKEYQNISELSRMAVVELIDRVRVSDKDHIEIDFNFQDCFQSALRQIQSAGCTVCMDEAGRINIEEREVV